jgi:hypothetical protein
MSRVDALRVLCLKDVPVLPQHGIVLEKLHLVDDDAIDLACGLSKRNRHVEMLEVLQFQVLLAVDD